MANKRKRQRLEALAKSQDMEGFVEEFQNESDRATAVLGAAFLDETIYQLLVAFFVDDEREASELLGVEKPLGTFGARVRVAYCVGLLAKDDFDDLMVIKNIRNAFAHQLHGLTFDHADINSLCDRLKVVKRLLPHVRPTPRATYTLAVSLLWTQLSMKQQADLTRCTAPAALQVTQSPSV